MGDRPLYIGDVAKESGFSTHAIRFYEKQRLVDEARRSASGYRIYDSKVLNRLGFIRKAQRLGFSLQEIRDIFIVSQQGQQRCAHVHQLATRKLAELDQQIQESRMVKQELQRLLRDWKQVSDRAGAPSVSWVGEGSAEGAAARSANRAGASICPHIERFIPLSTGREAGTRKQKRRG